MDLIREILNIGKKLYIVASNTKYNVKIFDVENNILLHEIKNLGKKILASTNPRIAFDCSSDGLYVALINPDNHRTINIYNINDMNIIEYININQSFEINYSPDNQNIAVSGPHGIEIINIETKSRKQFVNKYVGNLTYSSDGKCIIFVDSKCTNKILDISNNTIKKINKNYGSVLNLNITSDSKFLIYNNFGIYIYNFEKKYQIAF